MSNKWITKNLEQNNVDKVDHQKVVNTQCAKSSLHKRRRTHRRAVVALEAAVAVAAVVVAVVAAVAVVTAAAATATATTTTARLCVRLRLWRELFAHLLFNFWMINLFDIVFFSTL